MKYVFALLLMALSGCALVDQMERPREGTSAGETGAAPPPPPLARSVEEFDTTTEAQRTAAKAAEGGNLLGRTVASLGDPARPGFWMMTPLVTSERQGRLEYPAKGTSVEVTLIPTDGGSSRVSLAALRLLEAPLGDLSELAVFAN